MYRRIIPCLLLSLIACGANDDPPPATLDVPPREEPPQAPAATPEPTPPPVAEPAPVVPAPPICNEQSATFEPERPRTNVVFLLDRSGSMHLRLPSGKTRWSATRDTLFSVVDKLPALKMRASIAQFPQGDAPLSCCSVSSQNELLCNCASYPKATNRCSPATYVVPTPKDVDATTAAFMKASVNASNDDIFWGTPLAAALSAGVMAQKVSNNDGIDSVVLLTDGEPTSCETNEISDVVDAAKIGMSTANGAKRVRTFVLGIMDGATGARADLLNEVALAGGTSKAYAIDAAVFTTSLTSALDKIAREATDCTFDLPPAKPDGDLDKTNVTLDRTGGPQTLVRDPKHVQGWDTLPGNTQIKLYGDACRVLKDDAKAKVTVVIGCKTVM